MIASQDSRSCPAKSRYSDHPEVQAKIRTAMIEGKIADEDFNGDPEYNVLGQAGIRARVTKKKAQADDEDGEQAVSGSTSNNVRTRMLMSPERWWHPGQEAGREAWSQEGW